MMNGYNFTERLRRCLAFAREEAAGLNHEYVGTEHMLLGLIRDSEGVAAAVLQNLNVDLDEIKRVVEETIKKGITAKSASPDLPYTSRAKKVLELAMSQARELNHSYVGTEHLLLGLLLEEKGIAAQTLANAGVNVGAARAETLRLLGTPDAASQPSDTPYTPSRMQFTAPSAFASPVESIAMQIRLENGVVVREQFATVLQAIAYLSRRSL